MPIFTKDSLERLKKRVDLVEVMSSFIDLKRQGVSYKALCPFHEEKSPSFIIQKGDTHYHCFGCGAHGDAISFLMGHQRHSFVEAVEFLAQKFQVPLERIETEEVKGPPKKEMRDALDLASRIYHSLLLYSSDGQKALKYLYSRGISLKFIKEFELGLSLADSILEPLLKEKGISNEVMEGAGLTLRKGNASRDFFYDRIMFPIRASNGSIIGFSGRKYKEDTFGGKYVNTIETPLFKKSRVLFGLNYSRKRIAKEKCALIVEGQIDALRLIHEGLDFAVAGQGTAFGEEHVQELLHLGILVAYLAFDQDLAGMNATAKVGDLFQKQGIEVKIVSLPAGYDPDLYVKQYGAVAFHNLLKDSIDYITFLVKYYGREMDVSTPSGKNQMALLLGKQIRSWKHELMVHESLKKLANLLQVPESMLGAHEMVLPSYIMRKSDNVGELNIDLNWIVEVDLLRFLYKGGAIYPEILLASQKHLFKDSFIHPVCQKVFLFLMQSYKNNQKCDLLELVGELDEGEGQKLIEDLMKKKVPNEKCVSLFQIALKKLLDRNLMLKQEEIRKKTQSGLFTEDEELELAKEFQAVKNLNI